MSNISCSYISFSDLVSYEPKTYEELNQAWNLRLDYDYDIFDDTLFREFSTWEDFAGFVYYDIGLIYDISNARFGKVFAETVDLSKFGESLVKHIRENPERYNDVYVTSDDRIIQHPLSPNWDD